MTNNRDHGLGFNHPSASMRDQFAYRAMEILARSRSLGGQRWADNLAADAYALADAMLRAREER